MIGLGRALKALHEIKIFHRDMKSANVFLSTTPSGRIAKLGDFNVSTVAKKGLCLTQTGTPYYASPEIWRDMPYDGKSDMWSLGCVLYEMVAQRPPFRAEHMQRSELMSTIKLPKNAVDLSNCLPKPRYHE